MTVLVACAAGDDPDPDAVHIGTEAVASTEGAATTTSSSQPEGFEATQPSAEMSRASGSRDTQSAEPGEGSGTRGAESATSASSGETTAGETTAEETTAGETTAEETTAEETTAEETTAEETTAFEEGNPCSVDSDCEAGLRCPLRPERPAGWAPLRPDEPARAQSFCAPVGWQFIAPGLHDLYLTPNAEPVEIPYGFYMSETAVTQREWLETWAALGEEVGNPARWTPLASQSGLVPCEEANCPVVRLNWYEAILFANAKTKAWNQRHPGHQLSLCYDTVGCDPGLIGGGCSASFCCLPSLDEPRLATRPDPWTEPLFSSANDARFGVCDLEDTLRCDQVTLTAQDCTGFRLPTHAEQLAAYRCAISEDTLRHPTRLYCGDAPNCLAEIAILGQAFDEGTTFPVGSTPPNDCGIRDLSSNTFEWLWDSLPTGEEEGAYLLRNHTGGIFGSSLNQGNPSHGLFIYPEFRGPYVGVRLVRTISAQPIGGGGPVGQRIHGGGRP